MSDATATHAISAPSLAVDGLEPRTSLSPASMPDLQTALRDAHRDGHAVIAIGSGARLHIGNVPRAYHTALSTAALNQIVAYEPADMTITAQAGVRITDLQQALAEHGQFLPIDAIGAPGTVGGQLAANSAAPLRHRYGTARDWLIGLRVVHADGATSRSGGRVVKNVSGYDLHKAHIGAIGTLAIIAEATFKLAPLPKAEHNVAIACPSAAAATSIIAECHERGLSLIAAELLSPATADALDHQSRWTALLRIAGGAAAVARTARDVRDLASLADGELSEVDAAIWRRWSVEFASDPLRLRISVPPTRVADTAEALDRRFAGDRVRVSATATAGLLRVMLTPSDDARALALIDQVKTIVSSREGSVFVDAATVEVKRSIDVFGAARDDISIMRRLKSEFDPAGILAPGRFMGRL